MAAGGDLHDVLYFDHPDDAERGMLRIRGWCGSDTGKMRGRLRHPSVQDGSFEPMVVRQDVSAVRPSFDALCGFDAIFDTNGPIQNGDPCTVEFENGTDAISFASTVESPRFVLSNLGADVSELRKVKLRNLILNEAERLSHATVVRSFPITGHIDPAFSCNLECPHCLSHMARRDGVSIPVLKKADLDRILETYGPYLVRVWLALWGEPLLNKRLPEVVKAFKAYDVWCLISSNMSVPIKDRQIDSLLDSGLDCIIFSVDGATQGTYEKYRAKGDLGLVLSNMRRIVEAKRKREAKTHLFWKYIEFPWNMHEIDMARSMSEEMGIDEFSTVPGIVTPNQTFSPVEARKNAEPLKPMPEEISVPLLTAGKQCRDAKHHLGCDYLYQSISINSDGMIHPCCYVVSPAHSVGNALQPPENTRNHEAMVSARQFFAHAASGRETNLRGHDPCVGCSAPISIGAHVPTQTNFIEGYEHLLGRKHYQS